jgi:hypothetical protein
MTTPSNTIEELVGRVTRETLATCHMRETMHLNGGKEWFGYIHQCVEHPRLSRRDKYTRKDRGVQSTWRVDGKECADLDAALDALAKPVVLTDQERAALTQWRDDSDAAWAARGGNYEMMRALNDKGLLNGRSGITPDGLRSLRIKGDHNDEAATTDKVEG